MPEAVGSKERERFIQVSLNLPEESTGTVRIANPHQEGLLETKLRNRGSPDPGHSQATAPPFWGKKCDSGVVGPGGSWWFS
jgi:hypothetical protein